jgi:hypothetical protein
MKIFKKVLLLLFILLLLIAGGIAIAAFFYGDEIKTLVVENLNKNLKTEVKVSNVEFSVFQDFPKASVVFSDVLIFAVNAKNDTLLAAEKLSAQFNIIDLYKEQYNLIGLSATNGKCEMLVDNSGRANYVFWNSSDSSSNPISIELNNVAFSNMEYTYVDYSKNIAVQFSIEEAKLEVNFKENIFDLELSTTLKKVNVQVGEMNLFDDRTLFLTLAGNVDQSSEQLNFTSSNIGIDGMSVKVNGSLNYGNESRMDLQMISENTDLEKAIAILPLNIRSKLSRFKIDGKARLAGSLSGVISAISAPLYDFNFSVNNGMFKDKESNVKFRETNLHGRITNGAERNLRTTKLTLESFETATSEGTISGKLAIENFKKPLYEYSGKLSLDLTETLELLKTNELIQAEGNIAATLFVKGELIEVGKYTLMDWKRSQIEGQLDLRDLKFGFKSRPQKINALNGKLSFNNNSLAISELEGSIDNTKLSVKGKFNNLIAFLLDEKEPLFVDASVNSSYIHLNELLATNTSENAANIDQSYGLDISPRITVYLSLLANNLEFNKFKLNDLKGDLIIKEERIDARGISFNSQEGKVLGDLFIREKSNKLVLITKAKFEEVNIKKVFGSFNNFGQESIKAENLEGLANIDVNYTSWMSKQFKIDPNSIRSEINFTIDNGKLNNYKPLEALSKFVELDELKEIKFKRLQNSILIKDAKIIIPKFEILSSAINLNIAGTHTFNNNVDYRITLLLSEILGRKLEKPKVSEFGFVENDGLQKQSKLYLKMTGNIDNIKVAYDSEELKNNIKSKFTKEKSTVKSLLKEEFGVFKKDASVKPFTKEESKQSPFQVEMDSSFINKKQKSESSHNKTTKEVDKNEAEKKSKFGIFLDKIAKPNDEQFVAPIEN